MAYGPMGFGAGAAEGLEQVLRRKYLEVEANRRAMEAQQQFEAQAARDAANAEIARGNLDMRRKEYDLANQPKPTAPPRRMVVSGRIIDPDSGQVIYEPPAKPEAPQHPVSVAPGGRLVDPTTGKVVFAAPERPDRPERPGAPQIFFDAEGKPRAVQFVNGEAREVPLPTGLIGKTAPKPAAKTPEQIEAEAAARARGTATGKQEAGGGGIRDAILGLFNGGNPERTGAATTVRMKAPNGQIKEVSPDQVAYYKSKGAVEVQ